MKLHVAAFGCQMSSADGSEMAAPLKARGFGHAEDPADADAIILNTCTVRQHAEDKALSYIGRLRPWKDADPRRVLIVAGCAAERLGPWIQERFPFVDLVVGAKSIEDYPRVVEAALGAKFDALRESREAFAAPPPEPSPVSAFVTVMRGCNYSCSYCIVPAVRGRELYRPFETVMAEVRAKAAAGAREIVFLGQTVNSWRGEIGARELRFPDLLRRAAEVEGVARLRFESPHPRFVDDALIAAIAETPAVCEQVHLPMQSGSDRVLKLMRRNYRAEELLAQARRLRAAVPGIELSTDIIVGFPSESEDDFARTLDAVRDLRPSWSYTFKYSPREGTEAAGMPDDAAPEVKEDRLARLNEACDRLTAEALDARVGKAVEVLDETGGFGRTRDGFKVRWDGPASAGTLASVTVTGTNGRILRGEIR